MFDFYFLSGNIPANAEQGSYEWRLVLLSYVVASFASYIALALARRLADGQSIFEKRLTLWGGAFALGAGIWSMGKVKPESKVVGSMVTSRAT